MGLSFLKKPQDVVLTSTALEAGKEFDTSADEAATQIPGSAEVSGTKVILRYMELLTDYISSFHEVTMSVA